METKPFTITSDSAFTEEGVWLIEVHLQFTKSSDPASVILDRRGRLSPPAS